MVRLQEPSADDEDVLAGLPHMPSGTCVPNTVAEEEPRVTAMLAAGSHLLALRSASACSLQTGAERCGVSSSTFTKYVHAAAEVIARRQFATLDGIVQYIKEMAGVSLEPLAAVEHISYDATPAEVRAPVITDNARAVKVKVFAIEYEWAFLVKLLPTPLEGVVVDEKSKYLILRCVCSPAARMVENATAETTRNVLLSSQHLPRGVESVFGSKIYRLSETDEDGSNLKAERLMASIRSEHFQDGLLHCVCTAHKAHAAAERTWALLPDIMSGLIHLSKAMADLAVMQAAKNMLVQEVAKLQVWFAEPVLQSEAVSFREHVQTMFMPSRQEPRRRARMEMVCAFLNGDWRMQNTLVHFCVPGKCCENRAESVLKLQRLLPKALFSLRPTMICKGNWLAWSHQWNFFGWAACLHGVLQSVLLAVLSGHMPADAHAPQNDAEPGPWLDIPGAGAPPDGQVEDAIERLRQERNATLRVAVAFLKKSWLQHFWLMRVALSGQIHLMKTIVDNTSAHHEVSQLVAEQQEGSRDFRVLALHQNRLVNTMLQSTCENICHATLWQHVPETEELRSNILRLLLRPAAVAWQLISCRFRAWPWKLFELLDNPTEACAQALLHEPRCLRDSWSQKFVDTYSTVGELLSETCLQVLKLLATLLQTTTFSTERAHSRNLRFSKRRAHSKRMDLPQLAWNTQLQEQFHGGTLSQI